MLLGAIAAGFWAFEGTGKPSLAAVAADTGLPIDIRVAAVPLSHEQQAGFIGDAGRIRFAGGWVLSSDHSDFGGFSGLLIDAEANILLAINDKGDWWQAGFDARRLREPAAGKMRGYTFGSIADKTDLDAESLIRFEDGYLVAFEQNHRLEFVREVGGPPMPPRLAAIDFSGVSRNGGMEAIALLESGLLLAFSERGKNAAGLLKAWLVSENQTSDLSFAPPANFAPTDAVTLPGGDVLVLLRHYSAIDGVAVKLHHIKAADIREGAILSGTEVLHLTPEFPVDNMEGLDAVILDDNTVRLVMISDDNFNPLQRTLLMMFDYEYR